MLAEWFQYLLTPCPKHLRKMGYPQEIIATQARYRRCKAAWRPHLENSKQALLESAEMASGRGQAVILGSGVLLDVPLADLARRFEKVVLIDIVHLPWVRRHALRYPNVSFLAIDVTDSAHLLYDLLQRDRSAGGSQRSLLRQLRKPLFKDLGAIDFLASVNLLSQLPVLPLAYLAKREPGVRETKHTAFARTLIENHLLWLKASAEKVCLITDLERVTYDADGREAAREGALYGVKLPDATREWVWEVAPRFELGQDHYVCNRVAQVPLS